jgi:hypothetical protein
MVNDPVQQKQIPIVDVLDDCYDVVVLVASIDELANVR